jgi:AcrR family transcriptional regulator
VSAPGAEERIDGRQNRTLRSRRAICDACLDLVQEGVLQPSADQIAERAGVSRRSVFNHWVDLTALYDDVVAAGMERCAPLREEIPRGLSVGARVAKLAAASARFFEATTPFRRSMAASALVGPVKGEAMRVGRALLRQERDRIAALFAEELAELDAQERAELVEALALAVSPGSWEHLRASRGLSSARARAVMERSLRALLRGAGVDTSVR